MDFLVAHSILLIRKFMVFIAGFEPCNSISVVK
jgi:hypothetical protein